MWFSRIHFCRQVETLVFLLLQHGDCVVLQAFYLFFVFFNLHSGGFLSIMMAALVLLLFLILGAL